MKSLGEYRSYLLYQVEEHDGVDINTSSGSRYIRNSVLIFRPAEQNPKLGDEWRLCKNEKEAKAIIDQEAPRTPIQEQMKNAAQRSREQEILSEQRRQVSQEEERRRRERLAEVEPAERGFSE